MLTLWRRILYWCGLVDVVWFMWMQGHYTLLIVWRDPAGQAYIKYHGVWAALLTDGTLLPESLRNGWGNTERWYHYDKHPLRAKEAKRIRRTWRKPSRPQVVAARLAGEEQIV